MKDFSHLDNKGNAVMVDVSEKTVTLRTAKARSIVAVPNEVMIKLTDGDIITKKGSVFQTAIIAGIMGAKKTGELIPLCHTLGLENCKIEIQTNSYNEIIIDCTTTVVAKTGVEMEALVGASVAAITIYDMCKALSHNIIIKETRLIEKTGGKSDYKGT